MLPGYEELAGGGKKSGKRKAEGEEAGAEGAAAPPPAAKVRRSSCGVCCCKRSVHALQYVWMEACFHLHATAFSLLLPASSPPPACLHLSAAVSLTAAHLLP